jgi:hypothetical protein
MERKKKKKCMIHDDDDDDDIDNGVPIVSAIVALHSNFWFIDLALLEPLEP